MILGEVSGWSLMRNWFRKCSDSRFTASLFSVRSCCTRYRMASTISRWPSMYRGSVERDFPRRRVGSGITGMVKTLAMKFAFRQECDVRLVLFNSDANPDINVVILVKGRRERKQFRTALLLINVFQEYAARLCLDSLSAAGHWQLENVRRDFGIHLDVPVVDQSIVF